jgi:putative ABC transport system permease protein
MVLLQGRTFTEQDLQRGRFSGVVIDENLARKYFPDVDPIGQRVNAAPIIGVVRTVRDFQVLTPLHDTLYMPLSGGGHYQNMDLLVRTDGDPMRLAPALRAQVAALDPDQTIARIETLEGTLAEMLAPRRFTMILLGIFAGIALILAAAGIYGLLQYSTTQQTRDIGIRMALGARGIDVLTVVLRQGLKLTLIGVAAGVTGALALTRVLSSLLYNVTPTDPMTLILVSFVLIGVALLASYLPARRAARIDPMVALRYE